MIAVKKPILNRFNICFSYVLAGVIAIFLAIPAPCRAHEVIPAVLDATITGGHVDIKIRFTSEAMIAGIDLSMIADTNDAAQAPTYDALRALPPDELAGKFRDIWPEFAQKVTVLANGQPVALGMVEFTADPVGDVDVARYSYLTLAGDIPDGAQVQIGWANELGGIVIRQMGVDQPLTEFLQNGAISQPMTGAGGADPQTPMAAFASYVPVGFDHIVPQGLDHILFVLGLFFLNAGWRALLWQISAFTIAHTVTLAAGALGWVVVAPTIVEPLIAASIVFVAVENVIATRLHTWRPFVVFGFGLLHGLGFASVLGEFGLPAGQFIPALIGFNVGVEFGQLSVIAAAYLAVGLWFGAKQWYKPRIATPASIIIAAIGAWWFVERVFL